MRKKYKIWGIILLGFAVIMYGSKFFINQLNIESAFIKQNIVPAIWVIFIIIFILKLPKSHNMGHIRYRENIYLWTMFLGFIMLSFKIAIGLISGFSKNTYDLSVSGVLSNLLLFGPALIGREIIRSYVVGAFCPQKKTGVLLLIALIFSILAINTGAFIGLKSIQGIVICLCENVVIVVTENILLCYLVLYGGPLAALIYSGILLAFELLFPVQPAVNWLANATIGIAVPISAVLYIVDHYELISKIKKPSHEKQENMVSWLVTASVCIGILWFTMGVFPIYPTVVVTGSMEPMIMPGDLILVSRLQEESDLYQLKEGDIIQFQRDDIVVVHRISEVIKDQVGNVTFRTKGDNNSSEDVRLVKPEEIKGTLCKVIPKVGLPTLWLKGGGQVNTEELEF